jgi:hypothetical protein
MPHRDELWNALQRGSKGTVYRRKKRHQGADWTPEKDSALTDDGVWCPSCRVRHGYMAKRVLGTQYEQRNGAWHILWVCLKSGNIVKDELLLNPRRKPE